MKKRSLTFVLFSALITATAFIQGCSSSSFIKPGEPAPYTLLYMADGKDKLLSNYKGKTVALMFWATWCNFSKHAMDDFRDKAVEYKGRDDVVFIAVSIDESREEFDQRVKARRYNDNIIHVFSGNGPLDETYLRFGSPAIPLSYTIDPDGLVKSSGRRVNL